MLHGSLRSDWCRPPTWRGSWTEMNTAAKVPFRLVAYPQCAVHAFTNPEAGTDLPPSPTAYDARGSRGGVRGDGGEFFARMFRF